jgi:hypothetical protein
MMARLKQRSLSNKSDSPLHLLCFVSYTTSVVFKYALSGRVRRKTEEKVSWAAIARVSQEAGFKGVMIIRYRSNCLNLLQV